MRDTPEIRDGFAERVALRLKSTERAEATLPDRVMRAVREEGRSPSWWRRRVTIGVTPLGALAIAAGLAAIMVGGAGLLSKADRAARAPHASAARPDTVHVVRFVLVAPGASTVAVAGDFNRWDVRAHQLRPAGAAGVWSTSIALTPGRHEYAFVIDGTRWVVDPAAAVTAADEFGGRSSVVTVERVARPRSS